MNIKSFDSFINEKITFSEPSEYGTLYIYNDKNEVGFISPKYKGNIPIDPKKSFTDEEIIEQGYEVNDTFPNSILLVGGFSIKKEYRNKGYARESIKQYFLDNPDVENLFLYAIPWQGAINFWYKIGGKSILSVETDKKGIHYIQLNRDEILKNN
jgi:hypothetical protein